MFLLNSCLGLFSAARSLWRPFSRSYGTILPSSLTALLPSALGSSPHLPVSVYGTGTTQTIAAFLDAHPSLFPTYSSVGWCSPSVSRICQRRLRAPTPGIPSRVRSHIRVPTVLLHGRAGISTCCPSTTAFALALGPAFPREDQLYPGILRYSA